VEQVSGRGRFDCAHGGIGKVNGTAVGLRPRTTLYLLAQKMGVSESTLRRRLKHAGLSVERGLIAPAKQTEVLDALGWREMTRSDAK